MIVKVDVIIPVHNASETIEETVSSAMNQTLPHKLLFHQHKQDVTDDLRTDPSEGSYRHTDDYERYPLNDVWIDTTVCCYDDGSTDESLSILRRLQLEYRDRDSNKGSSYGGTDKGTKEEQPCVSGASITTRLLIGTADNDGWKHNDETKEGRQSCGAGTARNRAAILRSLSLDNTRTNNVLIVTDDDVRAVRARYNQTNPASSSSSSSPSSLHFLCLLDSDDVMHTHRIAEQVSVMMALSPPIRHRTLLGCTFDRIPKDATWHYAHWANETLTEDRRYLERYRELTVLQPTWMIPTDRFWEMGGYVQPNDHVFHTSNSGGAAANGGGNDGGGGVAGRCSSTPYRLVHPRYDTEQTLRLAEDLRFFHAHLFDTNHNHHHHHHHQHQHLHHSDGNEDELSKTHGTGGQLRLIRTIPPLLTYRHRHNQSQSSSTPRKLLLQLRVKALEDQILRTDPIWSFDRNHKTNNNNLNNGIKKNGFVIWGAGRDGKDFYKALSNDVQSQVRCFVDVDEKKIRMGYYVLPDSHRHGGDAGTTTNTNPNTDTGGKKRKRKVSKTKGKGIRIPIVHYSLLARDEKVREELGKKWLDRTDERSDISKSRPARSVETEEVDNGLSGGTDSVEQPTMDATVHATPSQWSRRLYNLAPNDTEGLVVVQYLKYMPIVVCVAMYRTDGMLEKNVALMGRTEGVDLWHFS